MSSELRAALNHFDYIHHAAAPIPEVPRKMTEKSENGNPDSLCQ